MLLQQHAPFPNPAQELLLKASLFSGDAMLDAWEDWKRLVDFEKDVDHGSLRLLPLLYYNLHRHQIDDPLMLRLKGIYRKSWSRNQILFHKTAQLLSGLQGAGVQTIALKGIALSMLVYRNHAIRPMSDMDIMVPFTQAEASIQVLKANGYHMCKPHLEHFYLTYGRSIAFVSDEGDELDLHWHPMHEARDGDVDNDFWDHAIPITVGGVSCLSMCAADNLLHTIVHGLRCNDMPPIRWVPDAVMLTGMKEQEVNWSRLLEKTGKYHVSIQVREALHYLNDIFHADVPDDVLKALSGMKAGWANRVVYRHAMTIGERTSVGFRQRLYTIYANHVRQSPHKEFFWVNLGFARYVLKLAKGRSLAKLLKKYFLLLFQKNQPHESFQR